MVVAHGEEMTDAEIISILSENGFSKNEMAKVFKDLKSRNREYVMEYIEMLKDGNGVDEETAAKMQEAAQLEEQKKLETERMERYRMELLEKIQAVREERLKQCEAATKLAQQEKKKDTLNAYMKVMLVTPDEELKIGFEEGNTMTDLFQKVKDLFKDKKFVLRRYGHKDTLSESSKPIHEELKARASALEVEFQ